MGRPLAIVIDSLPEKRRWEMAAVAVVATATAVADALSLTTLASLLGSLIAGGASSLGVAVPFAMTVVVASLFRLLQVAAAQHFAEFANRDLAVAVHKQLLAQPYESHAEGHSSEAIAALTKVERVTFGLLLPLVQACAALVGTAVILTTLLIIDAGPAVAALFAIAAAFAAIHFTVRRQLARTGRDAADAYGERVRVVQESLGGIRDVILDRSADAHVSKLASIANRLADAGFRSAMIAAMPRAVVEGLGIASLSLLTLLLVGRDGLANAIPIVGATALAGQRLLPLVQTIYQGWSAAGAQRAVVADVAALLALPAEAPGGEGASLPFNDRIELRDLSYRHPGAAANTLSHVSFSIAKGDRVVVIGPTGSGKSTLADLLMGLIEPTDGEMLIDGTALGVSSLQSWRRTVAHVAQSPFIADASLAQNIVMDPASTGHYAIRMDRAIELAGLTDLVASLPGGLDTRLGERGARLSGGQRQRIALARAIYRNAPLLVLDEATSALDDATERAVLAGLDRLQRDGTTIVIIAHRGGALASADQIIRLREGWVVDSSDLASPSLEHQDRP